MVRFRNLPVVYERQEKNIKGFKFLSNNLVVHYDNGVPVDRFDVFFSLPDGWIAWCCDTLSAEKKQLRTEICAELNGVSQ